MRTTRVFRLAFISLTLNLALTAARAAPLSDADIAHIYAQIEARRAAILEAEIAKPLPTNSCEDAGKNDCLWGKLNHGLALMYLDRNASDLSFANQEIGEAVRSLMQQPGVLGGAKVEGELLAEGEAVVSFHFGRAGLLHRLVRLFGSHGSLAAGRLTPANEQGIVDDFWQWASTQCRLDDTGASHIWRPWRSENHDAQRSATCWQAADLLRHWPSYASRPYEDGTNSLSQYQAWTAYSENYIRERARHGLIEFFSPGYVKYTLSPIYSYADFSDDAELKRLAHEFLDLWWAEWAEEQSGGMFGGAQARVHPPLVKDALPMSGVMWMYFAQYGDAMDGRHPGLTAAVTSSYAPPAVVADIALDLAGRGNYEAFVRAPGLLMPYCVGRKSPNLDACPVNAAAPAILRVAYTTPEFVLGSALAARAPAIDWLPASDQERWNGLVMIGDPLSRIVIYPSADGPKQHTYNAVWAIQSKGTQITQEALPQYKAHVADMRVWFGAPLAKVERGGWVFVNGPAYAAVRPVSGGYHWDAEDSGWMTLEDPDSAVILQAARKSDYPSFDAFQAAVLGMKIETNGDEVRVYGLGGAGVVSLQDGVGRVNGTDVFDQFDASIRSPFINQAFGSGQVRIAKGARSLTLDF